MCLTELRNLMFSLECLVSKERRALQGGIRLGGSTIGNSMDSLGPSSHASGSPVCFPSSLSQTALCRLHYQTSSQTTAGLVPFGTRWRPHHKRGWCDLVRLQAPPMYNSCARKHGVARGMQTSLKH